MLIIEDSAMKKLVRGMCFKMLESIYPHSLEASEARIIGLEVLSFQNVKAKVMSSTNQLCPAKADNGNEGIATVQMLQSIAQYLSQLYLISVVDGKFVSNAVYLYI